MKIVPMLLAAATLLGCAATYKEPVTVEQEVYRNVPATKGEILRAAKLELASSGYQIGVVDDDAGLLTTAPKNQRLLTTDADCGTTMGIDYLKDKRTSTQVAIAVFAEEGRMQLKASISGEYRPGDVSQDMMLSCVSRGAIEENLLGAISARLQAN